MNIHPSNTEISKIDWTPLFRWVNMTLGLNIQFEMNFENKRPMLVCPNLVEHSGIFGMVVKDVRVDFFNFDSTYGNVWATLTLMYEGWSAGSNGMNLGTVWYDAATKGWTFETAKDRKLGHEGIIA